MLSKQQCPHTGIVNFFTRTDPFVSIGSVIKLGARDGEYQWRLYAAAHTISGLAKDMRTAEERVLLQYREQKSRDAACEARC
jgi:hypothetical protein